MGKQNGAISFLQSRFEQSPMEACGGLLGHKSVKVTEKHYLAFVEARRKQLEDDVRKSWAYDPLAQSTLGELTMDLVSEKGTVQ